MQKITQSLSRSSEKDAKFQNEYLDTLFSDRSGLQKKSPKKKAKKCEEKAKVDEHIYQRLVFALRKRVKNEADFNDVQIIEHFECIQFDREESACEKCICGKTELVNLFYMRNKTLKKSYEDEDDIEYFLSTFIVGSECISNWYKKRNEKKKYKRGKPIEFEFMKMTTNGIIGHFREATSMKIKVSDKNGENLRFVMKKAWNITISNKAIFEEFELFEKDYKTTIKPKLNNALDLKVIVEDEVLKKVKKSYLIPGKLTKDSRHKFYLKIILDDKSQINAKPLPINFYLMKMDRPESKTFRTTEPSSGKDFLM